VKWSEKRHRILTPLKEIQLELRPPRRKGHDITEIRELRNRFNVLLEEYVSNVPFVPVSRCPVCAEPLELAIDTVGLDAPWWWDVCPRQFPKPKGCGHFKVFLGALDLHGRRPAEANIWAILPGPGAPYVIERLLSMDGMQAVLSTVPVGENDTGYLIVYFSSKHVAQTDLHQEWRRQTWTLYNESGEAVTKDMKNDPWDFELGPWLDREKLLWIEAGDASLSLRKGRPCPYEDLPGTRMKQIIGSYGLKQVQPPDGSPLELYGPF
jgi:hypothetical protein